METLPVLLTIPKAARYLGVSERTLRRWLADDDVPRLTVEGIVRIPRVALDTWVVERTERPN